MIGQSLPYYILLTICIDVALSYKFASHGAYSISPRITCKIPLCWLNNYKRELYGYTSASHLGTETSKKLNRISKYFGSLQNSKTGFIRIVNNVGPDEVSHIQKIMYDRSQRMLALNNNYGNLHNEDKLPTLPTDPYKGTLMPGNFTINNKNQHNNISSSTSFFNNLYFFHALEHLERILYTVTFDKLSSISIPERRHNGISFVMSGLFLQLALIAISTEVDLPTKKEIDNCTAFFASDQVKIKVIDAIASWLPISSKDLKIRWASRIVLQRGFELSKKFIEGPASVLRLKIDYLDKNETIETITNKLNHMIEVDSGGIIGDTFDEEDLSDGICAVLITTLYLRARWKSPPTLLNNSLVFCDDEKAPNRTTRMIRINDIMRYVELPEWDAEALEINYSTPGLTFFIIVPRGRSLRYIASHMSAESLNHISERMQTMRVAATLPLYTLRMTLLLPGKLQNMGISRLIYNTSCDGLKLSHGVQRIMFWSEAGRYAYKDDGIEWDDPPDLKIMVDRPYLFFVRWHNTTIVNGNFVL